MNPRLLILPLLAIGAAATLWWRHEADRLPGVPACTWRIGDRPTAAGQFEKVAADDPVRLAVAADSSWHWYVASWSQEDGTIALFPSPQLDTDVRNPVGAGRTLLPGRRGERQLAWPMRGGVVGVTSWLVVASREPLPELETLFATLRQTSNTTFPDGSMAVANPRAGAPADGPDTRISHPLLRAAFELVPEFHNGPMQPLRGRGDIFLGNWRALCAPGK